MKLIGHAIAAVLLTFSINAHAVLTCESGDILSTWYVGHPFLGAGQSPDYCTANGAELDYIRSTFTNLRGRKGNNQGGFGNESVTWFGDDAQFIANNL